MTNRKNRFSLNRTFSNYIQAKNVVNNQRNKRHNDRQGRDKTVQLTAEGVDPSPPPDLKQNIVNLKLSHHPAISNTHKRQTTYERL